MMALAVVTALVAACSNQERSAGVPASCISLAGPTTSTVKSTTRNMLASWLKAEVGFVFLRHYDLSCFE
jgi:hypothetical protein